MEEEGGAGAPQEDLSRSPSVTDSRAMDGALANACIFAVFDGRSTP